MLRRSLFATSLACLLVSVSGHARAAGAWIPSSTLEPIEQRVAVSIGPQRTTLWASLRFQSAAGPVGIVVPAPPGSSLDFSSDAWFEALSVATTPRVFPPVGQSAYCPGDAGPPNVFEIAGSTAHVPSPKVDDIEVLDDAAAVSTWAAQGGLALSPVVEAQLGTLGGVRFVAVRFTAPGGPSVTPTLRITMPGQAPMLPLSLTRAGANDLQVTTWTLGEGRAQIMGATPVQVPAQHIAWDAKHQTTTYEEERSVELANEGVSGALLESTSHGSLSSNVGIANGTASIDGVITAYFERASAYGDASVDPAPCVAQAASALASPALVSASCPRAALGVVDGVVSCQESPLPGEVDPAKLRCGGASDDLAVALSGLSPAATWLTRHAMQIPKGKPGAAFALSVPGGASLIPVRTANAIDLSGCYNSSSSASGGMSTGSSMGPAASSSSGAGAGGGPIFGDTGAGGSTSTGGSKSAGSGSSNDGSSGSDVTVGTSVDTSCDCSGVPADSSDSSDSCSSSDTGGDSCSGDSSGGDSCSGDSSGDSCDSGGGGDSCDSGGGGDSCDSGGSDFSGCSGGGGEDCSIAGKGAHRRRGPKLSPIALGLLALLAPLRRRGRRSPSRRRA